MVAKDIWEICVPSAHFSFDLKTSLKKWSLFKKKKDGGSHKYNKQPLVECVIDFQNKTIEFGSSNSSPKRTFLNSKSEM